MQSSVMSRGWKVKNVSTEGASSLLKVRGWLIYCVKQLLEEHSIQRSQYAKALGNQNTIQKKLNKMIKITDEVSLELILFS